MIRADEIKKAALYATLKPNEFIPKLLRAFEKALRMLRWLGPICYLILSYLDWRQLYGDRPLEDYRLSAMAVNAGILYYAFYIGSNLFPQIRTALHSPNSYWSCTAETLERLQTNSLRYSYIDEYGKESHEIIQIKEYRFFDDGQRLAINGLITRQVKTRNGKIRTGNPVSTIWIYNYFTEDLRSFLEDKEAEP